MKKYLYSIATFVVIGLLFASIIIILPVQIINFIQGGGFLNMLQNLVMIPFVAASAGVMLAGIPVVLMGVAMAYLNKFSLPIFLFPLLIIGIFLEYVYCTLLDIRSTYTPFILVVTGVTVLCVCLLWRFWIEPRIADK